MRRSRAPPTVAPVWKMFRRKVPIFYKLPPHAADQMRWFLCFIIYCCIFLFLYCLIFVFFTKMRTATTFSRFLLPTSVFVVFVFCRQSIQDQDQHRPRPRPRSRCRPRPMGWKRWGWLRLVLGFFCRHRIKGSQCEGITISPLPHNTHIHRRKAFSPKKILKSYTKFYSRTRALR